MSYSLNVYCIIVTYNAMKWVDKCLGSLRNSSIKVNPIVVDNCSQDDTILHIKRNYKEVTIIENNRNKGFGQANNQGINYARRHNATHYFLLNQDAWVHYRTIEELVNTTDKYNLSLASPIHLNGTGEEFDYGFYSTIVHNEEIAPDFINNLLFSSPKELYYIKHINAAAWLLSNECINKIGGFDPFFFHYGEDNNYTQRINYHKLKVALVPTAYINHDRIVHGNNEVYRKSLIYNNIGNILCDINYGLFVITKKKIYIAYKICIYLLKSIITLRFIVLLRDLQNLFRIFLSMPRIIRSRRINKTLGSNWLDITNL